MKDERVVTTLPQPRGRHSHARRRSALRGMIVPIVLILVGVLVLLYPVVSTQYNNLRQQAVVKAYDDHEVTKSPEKTSTLFDSAEAYNATHQTGPVLDPWLARISPDNQAYQEYLKVLGTGDTSPMSQLIVPAAGVNLPVYHGSDDYILQRGVGHLFGSSMPIGGTGTRAVLTGHTGLTNATLFDNLVKVKHGDAFYINTFGRHLKYLVDDIKVVLPEETKGLAIIPGQDLVTLVTCTPYGINTHRLLVTGHRVPLDPKEEQEIISSPDTLRWQWWMLVGLIVAALAVLQILVWAKAARRKRENNSAADNEGSVTVDELAENARHGNDHTGKKR